MCMCMYTRDGKVSRYCRMVSGRISRNMCGNICLADSRTPRLMTFICTSYLSMSCVSSSARQLARWSCFGAHGVEVLSRNLLRA